MSEKLSSLAAAIVLSVERDRPILLNEIACEGIKLAHTMFLSRSLVPLVVLTAIFSVGSSVLAFHGVAVPRGTGMLWSFAFQLMLTFWVHFDRRVRGFKAPFEFDVFVFFAWPFVIPYYTYKTRGKRGLLLGAGVWGLFVTPFLAAAIAKVVLTK